jgi:hypothetical protein
MKKSDYRFLEGPKCFSASTLPTGKYQSVGLVDLIMTDEDTGPFSKVTFEGRG